MNKNNSFYKKGFTLKALELLNKIIVNLSAAFLGIMTVLVLIQVFFRYVLNNPLSESQELSIYAMIYVVMLGCTIAVRNKTHIAVEIIIDILPDKLSNYLRSLTYIVMISFFGVLLAQGWTLTVRSMLQKSPSTGIPVGYISFSIPLCAFISILYLIEHLIKDFHNKNDMPKQTT